jgi:hypothetical protein
MKLSRTGVMAAAVLSIATMAFAQKPDFSGTWALDPASVPAPPAGAGGGQAGAGGARMMAAPGPMVVKQTGDTLTVERMAGENKIVSAYKLDGTESVNKRTMGQMGEVEIKSKAKFDGTKLTIVSQQPGRDGGTMEVTEAWSLDGGNLVIESTTVRGTQKRVYKKST